MKLTEKSPSVPGNEIISELNESFGINGGELKSGCPNIEVQIRKKLNKNFFTLTYFLREKIFRIEQ
jgi:hypothetical protein